MNHIQIKNSTCFCLFLIVLLIAIKDIHGQHLLINEVIYSNKGVYYDHDGDTPDLIELYNAGSSSVDLKDYKITDDTTETKHWSFPSFELKAGKFMVVLASDKNKISDDEFHLDFKLSQMEEPVYLISPSGEICDVIRPQCVPVNASLSRLPDGGGALKVLTPSPGKSNTGQQEISVDYNPDTIWADKVGGIYNKTLEVNLSNRYPGNKIYYTLNGDVPDLDDHFYTGPLSLEDINDEENRFANEVECDFEPGRGITKGNILRAVVYSDGCPASDVITSTFIIGENIKSRYNVPVVSLVTDEDNLFDNEEGIYVEGDFKNYTRRGKKWERPVHVEFFSPDGTAFLTLNAGMRIHGAGSRHNPQKSLRLYAREEYGVSAFNHAFFDQKSELKSFKTLLLRAANDWSQSLIKDELCQRIVEPMNIDYSAATTAVLFVNGEYWGIYSLRERQDKYYVENNYNVTVNEMDIITYKNYGVVVSEGNRQEYNKLLQIIEENDPLDDQYLDLINEHLDVQALIDFYIAHIYLANTDFPNNNLDMWRIRSDTAKWRYFFYDLDAAMMRPTYDHLSEYAHAFESMHRYPDFSTVMLSQLIKNPAFQKEFRCRFEHHLINTFNPARILTLINEYEKDYSQLVAEHTYRWHSPSDPSVWQKNLRELRDFSIKRPIEIDKQLRKNFKEPFVAYMNSSGQLNLQFDKQIKTLSVRIFSMSGIKFYEAEHENISRLSLKLGERCNNGIYVLVIDQDGRRYCAKIHIH
jgi:hypothetical protein